MEQFLGKFVLLREKTEGFEEYAAEVALPDAIREAMANSSMTVTISQNGDGSYHNSATIGDRENSYDFRLGQKFTNKVFGVDTENVYTVEGNKLKGEHVMLPEGKKTTSTRYFDGQYLISEILANGKLLKNYYKKE